MKTNWILITLELLLIMGSGSALRADVWQSRSAGPERRTGNTAVWTGHEMIVWGGGRQSQWLGDGARYNLTNDAWTPLSNVNAPSGRWFHAAVWTGKEMLVWGGRASFSPSSHFNSGARYNPATDTWTPMSMVNAPSPRSQLMAVWTGKEMIVWGGTGDDWTELNDGGRYNPETDTWTPISTSNAPPGRMEDTAVWTGTEMIVFGGVKIDAEWVSQNTGGKYNPVTDTWTPLPTAGAPNTVEHVAVWTGTEMIVWGGRLLPEYVHLNTGARYNPVSNTWIPLSTNGAPSGRLDPAAVWTGTEMVVWCGANFDGSQNDGARYNPATDSWTPMTKENAPHKRWMWRPDLGIWTGEGLLVYGGSDYPAEVDDTDYYLPYAAPPPPIAPTITQQPTNLTAVVGDYVSFSVLSGGTRPLSYQWFFEGAPLDGETGNTLNLDSVRDSQAGHYFVVVTNVAGAATSSVATLTIRQPRVLQLVGAPAQQEGTAITLPIQLISEGDVGGMTFNLYYESEFLRNPQFSWDPSIGTAFTEVNTNDPGTVTVTLALPGTALAAGTQQIGHITFFIRSIPYTLDSSFGLEILDMSSTAGETLSGNFPLPAEQRLLGRKITGDNNANDRLDIGDATVVLRYLANLEPVRGWDVTLNNLNQNNGLDSGDVIRILRAAAGIDPQPIVPAAQLAYAKLASGTMALSPASFKSSPGQNITVQVKLQNLNAPVSGAAFQLNYNTNALRVLNVNSYHVGTLVPTNALPIWNVAPAQNNFAIQSGSLFLAASSANPWSTNQGVLAEVTFQVQPGATNQYLWPIMLAQAEITEDGYINHQLGSIGALVSVRSPVAARLTTHAAPHNGEFGLTLSGDAGATYVVEASSDLVHWATIATVANSLGTTEVVDTAAGAIPQRFYRVRVGP